MTVLKVTAMKPRGKIFFTSWGNVQRITRDYQNLNIISIGDQYSDIYGVVPCKSRFTLNHVVLPSDLKNKDLESIYAYVSSLNGESILVHCEFGSSRSPYVVNKILEKFPEYEHDVFTII